MFERLLVNLKKRSMHNKIRKAEELIIKGNIKKSEGIYNHLLDDYHKFCTKATYFEKLSIYHDLLKLYTELKKRRANEKKPEEVITKITGSRSAVKGAGKRAKAKKQPKPEQKMINTLKDENMPEDRSEDGHKETPVKETPEPTRPQEKMTGDNAFLKTAFDDLYLSVQQKGNIAMTDAASSMKVDRAKIEEWAKIHEDHGLIKIYYPAFSSPQLISLEWQKKKDEDKNKQENAKKENEQQKKESKQQNKASKQEQEKKR